MSGGEEEYSEEEFHDDDHSAPSPRDSSTPADADGAAHREDDAGCAPAGSAGSGAGNDTSGAGDSADGEHASGAGVRPVEAGAYIASEGAGVGASAPSSARQDRPPAALAKRASMQPAAA